MLRSPLLCALLLISVICIANSKICSTVRPEHIRISHHDVDTHGDLAVDTEYPLFSWRMQDELDCDNAQSIRAITQVAYRLTLVAVRSFYASNDNVTLSSQTAYDSGKRLDSASTNVHYDGAPLISDTRYVFSLQYWSSTGTVSEVVKGQFRTALFSTALTDFAAASWIGHRRINMNELRKTFSVPQQNVVAATVFMSGMGYGVLYANGVEVDPTRLLDPGWTTYTRRVLYVSYDVTKLVTAGALNCIGVQLGLGFFTDEQWGGGEPTPPPEIFGPPPRLLLLLNILLSDGTTMNITSDTTWQGREGAHRKDSVYMGTFYDKRAERFNWSTSSFTDSYSLWLNASIIESPFISAATGLMTYQSMDPIRISPYALHVATSAARTGYTAMPPGVFGGNIMDGNGVFTAVPIPNRMVPTYDVQQNIAGFCTLTITGKAGMTVATRHAEILDGAGIDGIQYQGLNNANYQIITAADQFIITGVDHEVLRVHFTYHGYRYISIYANYINIESVICTAIHSETTLIGNFTSSSRIINQIQHNIIYSQLSNIMSLPTDCSQRQERRGWLGDASLSVDVALYNFDLINLYLNHLNNIKDVQHTTSDGSIPDTAPFSVGNSQADPCWAHAYGEITLRLYQHYNITDHIYIHYNGIKQWVDYLSKRASVSGLAHMYGYYGDWLQPAGYPNTNISLVTAYCYLDSIQTFIILSTIIKNNTNINFYNNLYQNLSLEFHQSFYNPNIQSYAEGYQTANILALRLPNVVPNNLKPIILKSLINNINNNNNHLSSGIIGISQLFPILSENNNIDLAIIIATQVTYPSYGYMFTNNINNATTVWETFHALYTGEGATDSLNHHMFNSIGAWFYKYLAGIRLNQHYIYRINNHNNNNNNNEYILNNDYIEISPIIPYDMSLLNTINAEVVTIYGSIIIEWIRQADGKTIIYNINIPLNSYATIRFTPIIENGRIVFISESNIPIFKRESGVSVSATQERRVLSVTENESTGVMTVRVGGGSYAWSVLWDHQTTMKRE